MHKLLMFPCIRGFRAAKVLKMLSKYCNWGSQNIPVENIGARSSLFGTILHISQRYNFFREQLFQGSLNVDSEFSIENRDFKFGDPDSGTINCTPEFRDPHLLYNCT
jgi:hypothetical protein